MPATHLVPKKSRGRPPAETAETHERGRRRWLFAGAAVAVTAAVAGVFVLRSEDEVGPAITEVTLTAAPATVELGDRTVKTWAFNGEVPGPEIRIEAGDVVRATVRNDLPQPLTIHWHGIALPTEMDGVPEVTQDAIAPGDEFVYEFTAPDPGTYFYHPHTGTQLDTGLYAPLIVEDPAEAGTYDREITLMLDDWVDGTGETPDEVFERLAGKPVPGMGGNDTSGMSDASGAAGMEGMSGMGQGTSGMRETDDTGGMKGMPGMSAGESADEAMEQATGAAAAEGPLGDDTGDVQYPMYLINGRPATDPSVFDVEPGERVRLRLINAGSDTPFRVALGGQDLTVVATDGFAVRPVRGDSILLGMGERYDAVVEVGDEGVYPLVAEAEGKGDRALAVLRAGSGSVPGPGVRVPELDGRLVSQAQLQATPAVSLGAGRPDRTYELTLTGNMAAYDWGVETAGAEELSVREGERVRLVLRNDTKMWHPIHLHGHTFQVLNGTGRLGPRKDTVIVPAGERVVVEFVADNPGSWALHCHNVYHAEAGMETVLTYRT